MNEIIYADTVVYKDELTWKRTGSKEVKIIFDKARLTIVEDGCRIMLFNEDVDEFIKSLESGIAAYKKFNFDYSQYLKTNT